MPESVGNLYSGSPAFGMCLVGVFFAAIRLLCLAVRDNGVLIICWIPVASTDAMISFHTPKTLQHLHSSHAGVAAAYHGFLSETPGDTGHAHLRVMLRGVYRSCGFM